MRKPPTADVDTPVAAHPGAWAEWPEARLPSAQDPVAANVIPLPGANAPRTGANAPATVIPSVDEQQERLVALHNELEAVLGSNPDWPETWEQIRSELEHADAEVARQAVTGTVPHVRTGKKIQVGIL
jgi:hypothetical protein